MVVLCMVNNSDNSLAFLYTVKSVLKTTSEQQPPGIDGQP
jgi:hypothetical protein